MDDQHDDDDVLIDSPAAAKMLGVSRQWMELRRAKGDGPPYLKLGDSRTSIVRYRRGDVRRWLQSRQVA